MASFQRCAGIDIRREVRLDTITTIRMAIIKTADTRIPNSGITLAKMAFSPIGPDMSSILYPLNRDYA